MSDSKSMEYRETVGQAYEVLSFDSISSVNGKAGVIHDILLNYLPEEKVNALIEAPDWNSEKMNVLITVNGTQLLNVEFNEIINEFSHQMLQKRISLGNWDNFQEAVKLKAQAMLKETMGSFAENFFNLQQNMQQITDESGKLLEMAWSAPYKHMLTPEMRLAGAEAIEAFGTYQDSVINRGVLAAKVYEAMVKTKEDPSTAGSSIKLPKAEDNAQAISEETGVSPELVAAIRQKTLDEVRAALTEVHVSAL